MINKKITFIARDEHGWEVFPKPYPASKNIPDWFKNELPYHVSEENPTGKKLIVKNGISNASFKKCVPMLDAINSGYIIPLWADVQVRNIDNKTEITWRTKKEVFERHGPSSLRVEPPTGYTNFVFKYLNTWIPRTPKGYSVFVTAPIGHKNLPFYAIPAIIDSDTSSLEMVPPMWLKNDFEGIIEKGTPMIQVIPFKRDNWESNFNFYKDGEYEKIEDKNFNSTIVSHYIKNHWQRKLYK